MSLDSSPDGETIGLIGVGLIGTALASRLSQARFAVLGHDIAADRQAAIEREGGRFATTAGEVFERCDRVILSLPDDEIASRTLSAATLRSGQTIIDATTGRPSSAERWSEDLKPRRAWYLEATISGSSAAVRDGQALTMVGGEADAIERCRDLFDAIGSRWIVTGPAGSASRMKLATNLALGLNRIALAESLSFAEALGLDPRATLEALRSGAAYSRAMDPKGEKMLARDYAPQARLSQHLKDVRLILELGAEVGAPLPFSELHRRWLEMAEDAGWGSSDNSAIIELFRVGRARS